MSDGRVSVQLGDVVAIQTGFPFKSSNYSDDQSDPKLLRGDNIAQGKVRWDGVKRWPTADTGGIDQYWLREGDVILAMDRPWIEAGLKYCVIQSDDLPCLLVQRVARLRGQKQLDNGFLRYVIGSQSFTEHVLAVQTGTAVPHISTKQIQSFHFDLPPLPEQRAIAATLGALDDKSELNRKMNATLEAMARALFRDWFVDFGPTRAKMAGRAPYLSPDLWSLFPNRLDGEGKPEGWEERSVYDFARVIYDAPFASKLFNTDSAGVPLIRIRDLATHEPRVWTREIHSKGHLIEPGDIVVGMDGEFRLHVWKGAPAWLNQRVCHFEPLPGVPVAYLADALIEPLAFFERGKVGTTVIHLGKGDIDTFRLLHPGKSLLSAFGEIAEALIDATVKNATESRTLAQTHDLLLPRLMSGELRVAEAERIMEEVV